MSYCVNCGVELAEGEKHCPLCDTEVINPRAPWSESSDRPYPRSFEVLTSHIDRRYVSGLITIFLMIPILISLMCDFLTAGSIGWSLYVLCSGALLFVYGILPFFIRRPHPTLLLAIDGAATILFLFAVERISGGRWFLMLGLPLSFIASLLVIALSFLFSRGSGKLLLVRLASTLISIGVFCLSAELFCDDFIHGALFFNWSPYVLIPCGVVAGAFLLLERRKNLKEQIRRRLFY